MSNNEDNYKPIYRLCSCRTYFLALLFAVSNLGVSAAENELTIQDLSVTDISILWPTPTSEAEIDNLLNATTAVGNTTIWPEDSFEAVLDFATTNVVATDSFNGDHQITIMNDALKQRETWKVVGIRVDPSAPSTDPAVIDSFGSIPQIRLIMQPVTFDNGRVRVHDFTAHLPFNYVLNAAAPYQPDRDTFRDILNDVLELKKFLLQSPERISTDGVLRVNPGLSNNVTGFTEKIEAFLSKHLSPKRVPFVAFMGIPSPSPEPWMFFDMTLLPSVQTGAGEAQILFFQDTRRIAGPPLPGPPLNGSTSNLGDAGVSTAVLFQGVDLTQPAIPGRASPLVNEIPNIIANPSYSNVLNTDCVSCHSETTRRHDLGIANITGFQYPNDSGVQEDLLPTFRYNVRNFGWFQQSLLVDAKPHITWRTANESAAALQYVKENY